MASGPANVLLRQLNQPVGPPSLRHGTDRDLLGRFAAEHTN